MSYRVTLLLSALVGYVTLSQEIVWVRLLGYATRGRPQVFAHVLGVFLIGVALGALRAQRISMRDSSPVREVARLLALCGLTYYLLVIASGKFSAWLGGSSEGGAYLMLAAVGWTAFLSGGIFPLLCHLGIRSPDAVGVSVAWIYVANIVGSVAGPLVTGFVLLDHFTVQDLVLGLAVATVLMAAAVVLIDAQPLRARLRHAAGLLAALVVLGALHPLLSRTLLEELHLRTAWSPYKHLVQNASGIIAVTSDPKGDIMWGGGVYDGRFNLDPVLDSNGIRRAYLLGALHANPAQVLMIGLSTGSWARVVADHRLVQHLTVVEINPAYLEVIGRYPEHATLLSDPKVSIDIDDGRRWLKRHGDARFDVIIMNTTYHWRSNITQLLSVEFLELCRSRLTPGGVLYYNTTKSDDVPYTTAQVFPHVIRYGSFVGASDAPFSSDEAARRTGFLEFVRDGVPVFAADAAHAAALEELIKTDLSDQGEVYRARRDLLRITDHNMASEYKRHDPLWDPARAWWELFRRRADGSI